MRCFCCDSAISLARKVKIRRLIDWEPSRTEWASMAEITPGEMAAYTAYTEQMTYRWAVICLPCYRVLDNDVGAAAIGVEVFNIAGTSRHDRASIINEAKYLLWQQREARKLGQDL